MLPFHYDAVAKHQADVLDFVRRDAESLHRTGVKVVRSADGGDPATSFKQCFERALRWPLETVPFDELDEQTRQEFRTFYQWFHVQYCVLLNFELAGRKVFYFDGSLLDRLVITEANVPSELLRLPFPSFAFVIDHPPFLSVVRRALPLEGEPTESPLSIYLTELQEEEGIHTVFVGDWRDYRSGKSAMFFKRSILVAPQRTLEEALETEWPRVNDGGNADERFFQGSARVVFRTLLNCILYLSSPTADLLACQSPTVTAAAQMRKARRSARKHARRIAAEARTRHSRLDYVHVGGRLPVVPFWP